MQNKNSETTIITGAQNMYKTNLIQNYKRKRWVSDNYQKSGGGDFKGVSSKESINYDSKNTIKRR